MNSKVVRVLGVFAISALSIAQGPRRFPQRPRQNTTQSLQDEYTRWKSLPRATQTLFHYDETRQFRLPQIPGCACASPPNNSTAVSPNPIVAIVNQPVHIRFDATPLCNGQGYRDLGSNDYSTGNNIVGSIKWEQLSEQAIYHELYGELTYPGYGQSGQYSVVITLAVQCYDTGAKCTSPGHYNVCSPPTVNVPVKVLTLDEAKKRGTKMRDLKHMTE